MAKEDLDFPYGHSQVIQISGKGSSHVVRRNGSAIDGVGTHPDCIKALIDSGFAEPLFCHFRGVAVVPDWREERPRLIAPVAVEVVDGGRHLRGRAI